MLSILTKFVSCFGVGTPENIRYSGSLSPVVCRWAHPSSRIRSPPPRRLFYRRTLSTQKTYQNFSPYVSWWVTTIRQDIQFQLLLFSVFLITPVILFPSSILLVNFPHLPSRVYLSRPPEPSTAPERESVPSSDVPLVTVSDCPPVQVTVWPPYELKVTFPIYPFPRVLSFSSTSVLK